MNSYLPFSISLHPFKSICVGFCALLLIPGLYWFTFRNLAIPALLSALSNWNVVSLMALGVLNLLILQAMCLRWALILKRSSHEIPFSRLVIYRLGANAVSYITPGPQFGGEPLQVHWLASCHGVPPDAAAASVVVDRLIELITNFCFIFLAGIVLLHQYYFNPLRQVLILAMICLIGVVAAAFGKALSAGRTPLTRYVRFIVELFRLKGRAARAIEFLERSEKEAATILSAPKGVLLLYGGCAGIQWLLMLSEFWFIYHVSGLSLDLPQLLALAGAARLAFLLPLPGALGVLEAGQLVVLTSLNIDPVCGLAACLIMRARDLLLTGTGAALSIHRLLRSPRTTTVDRCEAK